MHLGCSNSKKTVAPPIEGAHIPMILVYILLQPVVIRGEDFSAPKAFHFISIPNYVKYELYEINIISSYLITIIQIFIGFRFEPWGMEIIDILLSL